MLYIIQDNTSKLVKIGISNNPQKRLRQLQTGTGNKLRLLRTFVTENDRNWEKKLHKMLWQNRRKGKWFNLDPLENYLFLFDELFQEHSEVVKL